MAQAIPPASLFMRQAHVLKRGGAGGWMDLIASNPSNHQHHLFSKHELVS
jgi:hypothetical protein